MRGSRPIKHKKLDESVRLLPGARQNGNIGRSFHRGGFVSVLAIFFIVLFLALAMALTSMTGNNLKMSDNHSKMVQAQADADSGLAYAGYLLQRYIHEDKPDHLEQDLTSLSMPELFSDFADYASYVLDSSPAIDQESVEEITDFNEDGLTGQQFSIPVIEISQEQGSQFSLQFRQYDDTPESFEVICTGGKDDIQRIVGLNFSIIQSAPSIFDFALFAREDLMFNNGVTLDGYNFEAGDAPLQAGTNGTDAGSIDLKNSASIDGNVMVGIGGDPDSVVSLANGASITGTTSAMQSEWEPPEVTVPDALENSGSLGTIRNNTTISSDGKYDGIDLGRRETVRIEGDVTLYITGDIDLGNSATLEVAPNSKLTLFLGGDLELKNSAELNNLTQEVSNLMVLGLETCESVIMKNSSTTYASIYTPDADVDFRNSAEAYGAVVSKSFRQHNSAGFHYDAKLREVNPLEVKADVSIACDGNSYMEF